MTEYLTAKQYKEIAKTPKPSKYSAKRTKLDGHTFDSKREANRYAVLKQMQSNGFISDLELQPVFPLTIGDKPVMMKSGRYHNGRHVKYVADFRYRQNGKTVVEDVKGMRTAVYKLKKAVVEAIYEITVIEI